MNYLSGSDRTLLLDCFKRIHDDAHHAL